MATGGTVCRHAADSSIAPEEWSHSEAATLHERLVAYVHTLTNGSRRGVWGEHSYARARIGGSRGVGAGHAARVRVLLAPRALEPAPALLDVCAPPSPPHSPPALGDDEPLADTDADGDDDDTWEERVVALAPTAAHVRLAQAAVDALRRMRLERLCARGAWARREATAAAARRLRLALAPLWAGGGAAWLHAALTAHMPRSARRAYEAALAELRRAVPRLAARLAAGPTARPLPAPPLPAVGRESSPWLVWVSSGVASLDARWERRLGALVHTRVLRGAGGVRGADAAPPEAWCAAAAGAVRSALTDALAEAGSRSVVLGGVGAGAGVALVLARGAGNAGGAGGVRGAVLVAPPLLTAEGARDALDDALHQVRLPLLLVVGTAAPDCTRAVANNVCENGASRRLLEVRGADSELRLPRRLRLRHSLPQHALDAALVEECVRWAVETAEQEETPMAPTPARRHALPSIVREIDLTEEEYSHLPSADPPSPPASPPHPPAPLPPAPKNTRPADVVDVCMVSRGPGGTPLALLPPRRSAASPGALAAADIMQLPIVFADDDAALAAAAPESSPAASGSPLTVTSGQAKRGGGAGSVAVGAGSVKFTRVILAKRGARGGVGRGGGGRGGGAAPRRLLLRRGVRLVPAQEQ